MKKARTAIVTAFLLFLCVMIGFFLGRVSAARQVIPAVLGTAANKIDPTTQADLVIDDGRININLATARQLQMLPNIGEVLAERIVAYRAQHGPFVTVEDLTLVEGIGQKRLDALRQYITVGG